MLESDLGTRPDQVRGVAALVVAIAHTWQTFLYPLDKDAVAFQILGGAAMWAVATFFLLSGMLIAMSISRRVTSGFSFAAYIRARVLRIYPPLIMAVLVTLVCVGLIHALGLYGSESYWLPGDEAVSRERATVGWLETLSTITLTYKLVPGTEAMLFNGPLWSLVYEFWFYVIAGLFAAALANRSRAAGICILILCGWMVLLAKPAVPFWVFGAVWGMGFAAGWWHERLRAVPPRYLAVTGVVFAVAAALVAGDRLPSLLVSSYSGIGQNLFYIVMSGAIAAGMLLFLIHGKGDGPVARALAFAGEFSYTLYVVHFPLLMLLLSLFRPWVTPFGWTGHVGLALVCLALVIVVAERLSLISERSYRLYRLTKVQPAQ